MILSTVLDWRHDLISLHLKWLDFIVNSMSIVYFLTLHVRRILFRLHAFETTLIFKSLNTMPIAMFCHLDSSLFILSILNNVFFSDSFTLSNMTLYLSGFIAFFG